MNHVQQTSLFAYQEIQNKLGDRQKAVYDILSKGPMTDRAIAYTLGVPINEVTPRRGELVKMGLVRKAAITKQNGRSAIVWEVGTLVVI